MTAIIFNLNCFQVLLAILHRLKPDLFTLIFVNFVCLSPLLRTFAWCFNTLIRILLLHWLLWVFVYHREESSITSLTRRFTQIRLLYFMLAFFQSLLYSILRLTLNQQTVFTEFVFDSLLIDILLNLVLNQDDSIELFLFSWLWVRGPSALCNRVEFLQVVEWFEVASLCLLMMFVFILPRLWPRIRSVAAILIS